MVKLLVLRNTFWNMTCCHSYSDPPAQSPPAIVFTRTTISFRSEILIFFSFIISASVASRPGQSGRADGYILEGKELEFYLRKIKSKKTK